MLSCTIILQTLAVLGVVGALRVTPLNALRWRESRLLCAAGDLDDLALMLSARAAEVADLLRKGPVTMLRLQEWEDKLDALVADVRRTNRRDVLGAVYKHLLQTCAPQELDILQISAFDRISSAVVDSLIRLQPPDAAITAVVDELTDTHLDYIERFRTVIDDGGDDGYSQSSRQEMLCYQYATLVKFTYSRLSRGLGEEFDSSSDTQVTPLSGRVHVSF
jgi:hypothetical protein